MTEKFFIVTEESPLHKEYFDWRQNRNDVNEFVKKFTKSHGIEAHEYSASTDRFCIVPTENDRMHFLSQLGVNELKEGLYIFKKNSPIGKAWIAELKSRSLTVEHRPFVSFYMKYSCGRSPSRLFAINGILYMSFASDGEFEAKEGIREIRGSEFYKAIEDYEKQEEKA